MELTLTLSRSNAHSLLPDARKLPAITPDNFTDFAPRLRAVASELFQISSAGKPLAPKSAEVKIGGDADIVFVLTYPRPGAGALRFFAYYLGGLVDGHVGTLVVTHAAGDDLGWSPVSIDQPVFQVMLPPKSSAKKNQ